MRTALLFLILVVAAGCTDGVGPEEARTSGPLTVAVAAPNPWEVLPYVTPDRPDCYIDTIITEFDGKSLRTIAHVFRCYPAGAGPR